MTVLYHMCTGIILIVLNCIINLLSFRWHNILIEERRETSSRVRSEDLAPANSSRIASNPPVATSHGYQEFDMPQVELPVPSAKAALEESKLLSYLQFLTQSIPIQVNITADSYCV
jgi:hypothetical protein